MYFQASSAPSHWLIVSPRNRSLAGPIFTDIRKYYGSPAVGSGDESGRGMDQLRKRGQAFRGDAHLFGDLLRSVRAQHGRGLVLQKALIALCLVAQPVRAVGAFVEPASRAGQSFVSGNAFLHCFDLSGLRLQGGVRLDQRSRQLRAGSR